MARGIVLVFATLLCCFYQAQAQAAVEYEMIPGDSSETFDPEMLPPPREFWEGLAQGMPLCGCATGSWTNPATGITKIYQMCRVSAVQCPDIGGGTRRFEDEAKKMGASKEARRLDDSWKGPLEWFVISNFGTDGHTCTFTHSWCYSQPMMDFAKLLEQLHSMATTHPAREVLPGFIQNVWQFRWLVNFDGVAKPLEVSDVWIGKDKSTSSWKWLAGTHYDPAPALDYPKVGTPGDFTTWADWTHGEPTPQQTHLSIAKTVTFTPYEQYDAWNTSTKKLCSCLYTVVNNPCESLDCGHPALPNDPFTTQTFCSEDKSKVMWFTKEEDTSTFPSTCKCVPHEARCCTNCDKSSGRLTPKECRLAVTGDTCPAPGCSNTCGPTCRPILWGYHGINKFHVPVTDDTMEDPSNIAELGIINVNPPN